MELSKSLQVLAVDIGEKATLDLIYKKTWIMRLYTISGLILGVPCPFKLPATKIYFDIIQTGILHHATMVEASVSITEQIRRVSGLLSDMKKGGKTEEEMMEILKRLNLDDPQEISGNYLKFEFGYGADLNCSSLNLVAGDSFTIDSLEICAWWTLAG